MRGLPPDAVKSVVPGMSPLMDILVNGSTQVNRCRAEQSGSVALATDDDAPPVAREVKLLTPADIETLIKQRSKRKSRPSVQFSLFVQLNRDLDPEIRAKAQAAIGLVATRARWKQNAAVVELAGTDVSTLEDLHHAGAVSYFEPGQTLRGPEPAGGGEGGKPRPRSAARRRGGPAPPPRARRAGRDHRRRRLRLRPPGLRRRERRHPLGGDLGPGRHARAPRPRSRARRHRFDEPRLRRRRSARRTWTPPSRPRAARNMAATSLEPQSAMVAGSHGTHVASIAAGNRGVARQARLAGVLVALRPGGHRRRRRASTTRPASPTRSTTCWRSRPSSARTTSPLPVSINISLGTNGHAHDTSSAMARWIDNALSTPGRCVSVAAGNAGQVEPRSATDRALVMGRIHAGGHVRRHRPAPRARLDRRSATRSPTSPRTSWRSGTARRTASTSRSGRPAARGSARSSPARASATRCSTTARS